LPSVKYKNARKDTQPGEKNMQPEKKNTQPGEKNTQPEKKTHSQKK
jgi:hypothetical protein